MGDLVENLNFYLIINRIKIELMDQTLFCWAYLHLQEII
jgi:hypothetical protein